MATKRTKTRPKKSTTPALKKRAAKTRADKTGAAKTSAARPTVAAAQTPAAKKKRAAQKRGATKGGAQNQTRVHERTTSGAQSASIAHEGFRAVVGVGHKQTHYVLVPFDPRAKWPDIAPVKIPRPQDPRGGKGWLVTGTINGVPFDGHIGQRYGSTYLILEAPLLAMAKAREGDSVAVDVAPLLRDAS
jgi:hypothetical protein